VLVGRPHVVAIRKPLDGPSNRKMVNMQGGAESGGLSSHVGKPTSYSAVLGLAVKKDLQPEGSLKRYPCLDILVSYLIDVDIPSFRGIQHKNP
jgi:hypothetical protein